MAEQEFVWLFVTPFVVLLIKTAFRYVTKIAVFVQEKPDPILRRAAHFDCLRTGVDMAIIGLVATLAVLRLALKLSQQTRVTQVSTQGLKFILLQVALLAITAFLSAIFYSPERGFMKGVFVPLPVGVASVCLGMLLFEVVMSS